MLSLSDGNIHIPQSHQIDFRFFKARFKVDLVTKGQLTSEQIDAVINFPKMQQNIARISALASKTGQIKKNNAIFHTNW